MKKRWEIDAEMCGDEANGADAENVVRYLNEHGYDVAYAEAANNNCAECPIADADWDEALRYALEQREAHA